MVAWSRLDLGVGLIACSCVDLVWPGIADLVDVVEVEPQTLWDPAAGEGRRLDRRALHWLRSLDRPMLSHGVGFPVGGMTPPDGDGVRAAAASARELDAVQWSEHLSFNRVGGDDAGYLLPPVPTIEVVEAAVSHIGSYTEHYDRPFLVETPTSYLRPRPGDLSDGQFVAEIAERADCGILLDLHNIWANELNGRQPVSDFLAELPLERVWEVHFAGGFEFEGYHLDAHVGPISGRLLDIARHTLPLLPHVRALIFEAVPESVIALGDAGLRAVLEQLQALAGLTCAPRPAGGPRHASAAAVQAGQPSAAAREASLLSYTTRAAESLPDRDDGARVLRLLTDEARLSLLVGGHSRELQMLYERYGHVGARAVLDRFLAETRASAWPQEQGAALDGWLARHPDVLGRP